MGYIVMWDSQYLVSGEHTSQCNQECSCECLESLEACNEVHLAI